MDLKDSAAMLAVKRLNLRNPLVGQHAVEQSIVSLEPRADVTGVAVTSENILKI